jgi:hypothetical protein
MDNHWLVYLVVVGLFAALGAGIGYALTLDHYSGVWLGAGIGLIVGFWAINVVRGGGI